MMSADMTGHERKMYQILGAISALASFMRSIAVIARDLCPRIDLHFRHILPIYFA
jgi:hypothetical protein